MNKKVLIAGISILLTSSLASCAQIKNQINLTPEESRNLRIASSLGTLNHLTKKDSKALENGSSLEKEIENILYSVEVLLVNDFNVKTTNKAEGDFYTFGENFTTQETISFLSSNEKEVGIKIFYRDKESKNTDVIKYDENIEGVVTAYIDAEATKNTVELMKICNFTSTSTTKNSEKGEYLERKLTLYHESSPLNIFEVYEYESNEIHQFYYKYLINGKDKLSYSIDLYADEETSMMFSLLGYRLKFIRIDLENQVTYKVGVIDGDEFVQILKFQKVIAEDGTVSYHFEIEI